jgi:hypothetical protein
MDPDKIATRDSARAITCRQWNERSARLAKALIVHDSLCEGVDGLRGDLPISAGRFAISELNPALP